MSKENENQSSSWKRLTGDRATAGHRFTSRRTANHRGSHWSGRGWRTHCNSLKSDGYHWFHFCIPAELSSHLHAHLRVSLSGVNPSSRRQRVFIVKLLSLQEYSCGREVLPVADQFDHIRKDWSFEHEQREFLLL